MEKPEAYFQTVFEDYFKKCKAKDKKTVVASDLRNQGKLKQNIFFEKNIVSDHFKQYVKK